MSEPVLELSGATMVRAERPVLDNLTLTIAAGEHTAILGPNGAGKSAFVRLLTHEDRPVNVPGAAPPIRVFGSDRWDVFELRSQLGIVSSDLHFRFVFGNNEGRVTAEAAVLSGFLATHGILRYRVVTAEMRRRAADALDRMGVAHLTRRHLDEMSSGEARRVLLARALVTAPRALVLDEPTTGLDLIARHAFMEARAGDRAGGYDLDLDHASHRRDRSRDRSRHPAGRWSRRRLRPQGVGANLRVHQQLVRWRRYD